jgi:hypothetical protein
MTPPDDIQGNTSEQAIARWENEGGALRSSAVPHRKQLALNGRARASADKRPLISADYILWRVR